MIRYPVALLMAALLAAAGCKADDKKKGKTGSDKQIVALKKDSKKLKEDTDELLKRRGTLQRSRAEIEAARKAIEKKRAKLPKDDIAGHAELAKEELALEKKARKLRKQEQKVNDKLLHALQRQEQFYARATAALAAHGGGGKDETANVRGREHAVALREKAVARREREVARREKAVNDLYRKAVEYKAKKCATAAPVFTTITAPAAPAGGGGRSYSRGDAKSAFAKAMSVMSQKGIRLSDLPSGFAKLVRDIRKFIKQKEYARAKYASDQLRSTLRSIKIDRGFVGAKMSRLAAYIRKKNLSGAKRKKVNQLFVKVTTSYNDGRFRSANAMINKIYRTIR
jgi:hypothetical protein